jgi:beta-glucanase (GH16 family)
MSFKGSGNWELQCYTAHRPQNLRVKGRQLIIHANVEAYNGKNFTSARITSKNAWTYGRFEARAKLPKGKMLWPAIWLLPQNNSYGQWFGKHLKI